MKEYYEVIWKGYSKNSNNIKTNTRGTETIYAASRNEAISIKKNKVENSGYKVTSIDARAKKK